MGLYDRVRFSDVEAWIEKKGEEATVGAYARDFGLSVWTAAETLEHYVRRGDLREERRGELFQGIYFASVYRLSAATLQCRNIKYRTTLTP